MDKKGMSLKLSIIGILLASLISACSNTYLEPEDDGTPSTTVEKLNKNVLGLMNLANVCMKVDSIAFFNIEYNDDGSVLYWLRMKNIGEIELYSEIVSEDCMVPELSMKKEGNSYYWSVNGSLLKDKNGRNISVTDISNTISFHLKGDVIYCKTKNYIVGKFPVTKAEYLTKDVAIEYDDDNKALKVSLSSGLRTFLPTTSSFRLLEDNVLKQSFYKDVFLDAGIGLTSRKSLAAAEYLGLSLEGMSFSYSNATSAEYALQDAIVSGDSSDSNGRLLYPDGQPRYKLLFVNGGNSTTHGHSIRKQGIDIIRAFVKNGGSYVGTCAGAFLASNGYDTNTNYPFYLSIWPGIMNHTGLANVYTGMSIEEDSPLLKYYSFGGDYYVENIRHNTGGYPIDLPAGTEVLARYDYPKKKSVHMQPSIWAYKESPNTGRVIQEGSHPEEVTDGEQRDLTAAMMLYAMDGVGVASIKGFLKNGAIRIMDKKTSDNNPDYTRIGDLQTHHFAAYIPSDAHNIRVELTSSSDCDLSLMMSQESYAFPDVAEYHSSVPGAHQSLSFPTMREGLWFIGVQCLTTVTVKETEYGQEYSGNLEVLNGIPYRISISWE